jgi:hypothetical protein
LVAVGRLRVRLYIAWFFARYRQGESTTEIIDGEEVTRMYPVEPRFWMLWPRLRNYRLNRYYRRTGMLPD